MKRPVSLALVIALCLALFSGCGARNAEGEKTQIIRIAFNQPESHVEYQALADFGEKFKEATDGRYEVQIYPNAVLGDQGPVTEMIRTGALQMAVVPISVPESYNADFAIIAAPYLYDNLEQMETAAREGCSILCSPPPTSTALRASPSTPPARGTSTPTSPLKGLRIWQAAKSG